MPLAFRAAFLLLLWLVLMGGVEQFVLGHITAAIAAGVDIARRAFDPRLPLEPGFVVYRPRLPAGLARYLFTSYKSLLPGTVPCGDVQGGVIYHCLDVRQPIPEQLAAEETRMHTGNSAARAMVVPASRRSTAGIQCMASSVSRSSSAVRYSRAARSGVNGMLPGGAGLASATPCTGKTMFGVESGQPPVTAPPPRRPRRAAAMRLLAWHGNTVRTGSRRLHHARARISCDAACAPIAGRAFRVARRVAPDLGCVG
jgi:multisubunit Na+/H+ antiporter MnhE subunit